MEMLMMKLKNEEGEYEIHNVSPDLLSHKVRGGRCGVCGEKVCADISKYRSEIRCPRGCLEYVSDGICNKPS